MAYLAAWGITAESQDRLTEAIDFWILTLVESPHSKQ